MKYRLRWLLIVAYVVVFSVFAQERTVGVFNSALGVSEGYTLFSPSANNVAYLIDNCGQLMHSWDKAATGTMTPAEIYQRDSAPGASTV